MTEQEENIRRVTSNIGYTVFKFCSDRFITGRYDFTANELTAHVKARHPEVVNDSCARILRKLRADGVVNYGIVGARKQGIYTLIAVREEAA